MQAAPAIRMFDANTVEDALDFETLIERLRQMFRTGAEVPMRPHYSIPTDGPEATLLLMPAWQPNRHIGLKVVTVFPGNATRSLPSVLGLYLLLDGQTGTPLAIIDGKTLTWRRTAAASALAASYLAHPESKRLLMVGAGALAPYLIRAHATIRPITEVMIWNRTPAKAQRLAADLQEEGFSAMATDDLESAARHADVISCATLSQTPLIQGKWLRPGAHLDLVGGYTPTMREADDEAIRRATLFVDTREGALAEAGDIIQPLHAGLLTEADITADLYDLCHDRHPGRQASDEITLFKSVGTALEDLAAAQLVLERNI